MSPSVLNVPEWPVAFGKTNMRLSAAMTVTAHTTSAHAIEVFLTIATPCTG
jgi:hypothetical protein